MSWLISLVVAGLMFTSGSKVSVVPANHNYTESKSNVVKTMKAFDETDRFSQTYPLSASGRVSISNVNGSITIDTWDRNEVKLEYVKTADDRSQLATFTVKIDSKADSFSAETEYDDFQRENGRGDWKNHGKSEVQYVLTVPRNAVLDEIETVNGSVIIANAANKTKASSVNGEVKATNLRGAADLSTVNGTVEANFDQLQTGSRISLNTVNGHANLVIPSDSNATVKADTVNGSIANDFGLPVRKGEYVGHDLYGKIGSGDVQIRLNSVNGALSVKHKDDGKSVNPATDLLNMKNEDSWDDDEDSNNPRVKAPRLPETPRAPRAPRTPKPPTSSVIDNETRKSIEEGMKESRKQIEKMRPQIEKMNAEALKQAAKAANSPEVQAQIKEAQERFKDAFAGMSDINWTIGSPSVEEKSESFTVKDTPQVTIEAGNCSVSVRGWDKSEVHYSATRISKFRNPEAAPLNLQATQNGSDVNIKFVGDAVNKDNNDLQKYFFNDANQVRIEIFVPKKSNLKIVTGGSIRLENVSGDINLQGAEESVNVRDADGKLSAQTSEGIIRVIGFKGEADTRTSSGAINLEGDFHNLSAHTADGTIVLTLPENANANIESNRKDVAGEGVPLNFLGESKGASTWKVGNGGEKFLLYATDEGRIIIRGTKQLQN